jgi:N-acyl-L-homoserine lactone synthetase
MTAAGSAEGDPGGEPDAELAPALAVIDKCVLEFFAAAPAVRVGLASAAERESIYRLRYRVVVERGWANPDEFPEGMEFDADDERAYHVVAWVGSDLAATTRIILPSPDRPLPTERVFGVTAEPRGRVAHIDRVAVAPEYADVRHGVLMATLGRAWQEVRVHGYCHWMGVSTIPAIRLYRLAGLQMSVLGPPRFFWGEERYPIRLDPVASAPVLAKRWLRR